MNDTPNIIPLGDSAFIIRLRENLDTPDETLALVLQTLDRLKAASLPGITEMTPAFASVGVFFDPVKTADASGDEPPGEWLTARIRATLAAKYKTRRKETATRPMEVPVCYEGEFAPDLSTVADYAALSEEEVVQQHAGAKYRVQCIGFTPGFPYLSGLPAELATPRRATPRKQVPVGAVAIGGALTGIYPQASPGGWNIIGRTPLRLFDVTRQSPAILQTGDRVRFRIISREEFDAISTR
jgi:inhibitor of KinA